MVEALGGISLFVIHTLKGIGDSARRNPRCAGGSRRSAPKGRSEGTRIVIVLIESTIVESLFKVSILLSTFLIFIKN